MSNDNIPPKELSFHKWVGPFSASVTANSAAWKLDSTIAVSLADAVVIWNTVFPAHIAAHLAATGAAKTKDQAHATIVAIARPLIQSMQSNVLVTDTQRKENNINVRSKTRTRVSKPATTPTPSVDTVQRLRHIISYTDSVSGTKRRPPGVKYCEIWAKIGGPAPTDESQLIYLGNAVKSPQIQDYPATQAGLTVWYWLRWVNSRGEVGPWSVQIGSTIPG